MYTAQLIAVPAHHDDATAGGQGLGQALGSLGVLAGIRDDSTARMLEALAILRSRSLIEQFISGREMLPALFPEKWDASRSEWFSPQDVPSLWDGYLRFSEEVLSVTEDVREGLIYVRITWTDPAIAAQWANALVTVANNRIREEVIQEASANVTFLREELERTALLELRQAIFALIEVQVRKTMLANTRPDYAFKVIDPAKEKDIDAFDYPKAAILLPAGLISGTALYLLIVLAGLVFSSASVDPR
jgi:hypothetical protein